jgi:hypothetical protein
VRLEDDRHLLRVLLPQGLPWGQIWVW